MCSLLYIAGMQYASALIVRVAVGGILILVAVSAKNMLCLKCAHCSKKWQDPLGGDYVFNDDAFNAAIDMHFHGKDMKQAIQHNGVRKEWEHIIPQVTKLFRKFSIKKPIEKVSNQTRSPLPYSLNTFRR